MSRQKQFKEELELDLLLAHEEELRQRELEFARNRQRIEQERIEQERTIPPLEDIQIRARRKHHEEIVSRGEIANIRRDHNRSLLILFLFISATAALVWWGLTLMRNASM